MSRFVPAAVGLVLLAAAGAARAGVVITTEQSGGPDGQKREMQVFMEPDRLKMPQPRGGIIYRADQDKAWSYDDERKSYVELSRESMGALKAQMDAAMAQMRQQMANMPPDQRKMVEEMMAKQGGGAMMGQPAGPPPTVTFEKAGGKQTIGKWSCEGFARMENGRKTDDMCIARLGELGLTRDDMKAFGGLTQMLKSSMGPAQQSGAAAMDFDTMSKAIGFDGAPVRSVHYLPNGVQHETVVKAIERKSLSPDLFELPSGYAKQEMGRPPAR